MLTTARPQRFLLPVILLLSLLYLAGVPGVPFHPDEATQLFTSADLETLFHDPASLAWRSTAPLDARMHYRLVDAPLTRWLLGLGRQITRQPALPVDWNWAKTWDENRSAGALPSQALLLTGRFTLALLFPFSLWLTARIGRQVGSEGTTWFALLLMAGSALVLLHTRRAMAEPALLFCELLFLWAVIRLKKHRWLAAIPLALAVCAKQSTAPLALIGLLAIWWPPREQTFSWKNSLLQTAAYGALFLAILFALNPFLWHDPFGAAVAAVDERSALMADQLRSLAALQLTLADQSAAARLLGLAAQLFVTPPAFADVGNYLAATRASEQTYLANPLNNLLRGVVGGGLMLALTLWGTLRAGLCLLRRSCISHRSLALVWLAGLLQFVFLLIFIPIPWQRYYLPLVPFVVLWTAWSLAGLVAGLPIHKK